MKKFLVTGWYAGLNAGLGVSQTSIDPFFEGSIDRGGKGFAGGAQAGLNWQFAPRWVAGFEGDIGYLGVDRALTDWRDRVTVGVKTNWYGTLRGRLGYTNGPSLFYGTGGAAFVNVKNSFERAVDPVATSKYETHSGWTAGGGIETVLNGNWSRRRNISMSTEAITMSSRPFRPRHGSTIDCTFTGTA